LNLDYLQDIKVQKIFIYIKKKKSGYIEFKSEKISKNLEFIHFKKISKNIYAFN
jgi:hypothetical protein